MEVSAQELRLHDARTHELGFLAAALGAFAIAAAICNGATPTQGATEPICQRRNGRPPEEQGMDSKELAKLIDFGKTHSLDSLLVVRRGKIVAEAYYAPYAAGILHETARSHWMDSIEWESERTMALMVRIAGFPRVSAVKGTWLDDHTFVIDRLVLGLGQSPERWHYDPQAGMRPPVLRAPDS